MYPRYFIYVLEVSGDGEYDAMDFQNEGFNENDGIQFCLANNGHYTVKGENICVNLYLNRYFFHSEDDRDTAHKLVCSVHNELQTYDRSKTKELYYVVGCHKSEEEEEREQYDAEIFFKKYKLHWDNLKQDEEKVDID